MSEITAVVAGGNSRTGGGVVRFDLLKREVQAQRTLKDGTQVTGAGPLSNVDHEALLKAAAAVTAEQQAQVRAEARPVAGQFVEVHRGDEVVRVENREGQLTVEPAASIVSRAIYVMQRIAPPPAPHS